ncbi:MAG: hypothetical protein IPK82_25810 [Polyangiaceae bacterium]|nr:hypothetical protein [Polyangiaceae bacterium]
MALYELSIEAAHVREGERLVSLEGRAYPTLAMRWETRLMDQPWETTVILDYSIALPPLMVGRQTFNEVRIGAFVGGAGTKFLYFGTEMNASVPRVPPEMENTIGPSPAFQEFRLEEATCPVPYLKLINTTPRIYGNGPQDYYAPPIKVERYDAAPSNELIADFFPTIVAGLDGIRGATLTDSEQGMWIGSRFVGVTKIAILRQGKVVGLHRRLGRTDKDPIPPEVKRRDPKLDVSRGWCAIDVGAQSFVVAVRTERSLPELIRLGPTAAPTLASDFESPSEISFENLSRVMKAWRERVIYPLTRWEDVSIGQAAKSSRIRSGGDAPERAGATLTMLPLLRERIEHKVLTKVRGRTDPEAEEALKKPAPPIIDEDGIGAHDPFDPIELYGYYLGLHVNQRSRGITMRYAVAMPAGWSADRRQSVLVALRRGIFRSLPAGIVDYHDTLGLEVVDAGPSVLNFAVHALRAFGVQAKEIGTPFVAIDAGASETGMIAGHYRTAKGDEKLEGLDRIVEHLHPGSVPWLGGERVLHRLGYRVIAANHAVVRTAGVMIEPPGPEETQQEDAADLVTHSTEARANTQILRDALRPLLEGGSLAKGPLRVRFATTSGGVDVALNVDSDKLREQIQAFFADGAALIKQYIVGALSKIGRDPDPYDGLRILLGGRLGMDSSFAEKLQRELPANVQIHRFKEPDRTNISAPTVKTATALGVLSTRYDKIGLVTRTEQRDSFRYRVGKARHGQFMDVLGPTIGYDEWREMGACTKADVEVLFMIADDDGDVAADDPRVMRAGVALDASAVGKRLWLRAVGPARVELAYAPPGDEPGKGAPRWGVDLLAAISERL